MEQFETRKKMSEHSKMSNCVPQETVIKNVRLAAAYVPYETACILFTPLEALKKGTAFPELYSPYEGEDKKISPLELSKKERNL